MTAPLPEPPAVRPTCPYCGVGCGLLARPDGYGGAEITGDPDHPANFGRICSKGAALGETLSLSERLLYPMLRQEDGRLARVDWPVALGRVAPALHHIPPRPPPHSPACGVPRCRPPTPALGAPPLCRASARPQPKRPSLSGAARPPRCPPGFFSNAWSKTTPPGDKRPPPSPPAAPRPPRTPISILP